MNTYTFIVIYAKSIQFEVDLIGTFGYVYFIHSFYLSKLISMDGGKNVLFHYPNIVLDNETGSLITNVKLFKKHLYYLKVIGFCKEVCFDDRHIILYLDYRLIQFLGPDFHIAVPHYQDTVLNTQCNLVPGQEVMKYNNNQCDGQLIIQKCGNEIL